MAVSAPPAPKVLVREREGLSLFSYPSGDETLSRVQCSSATFSCDGKFLSLSTPDDVTVVDSNTGKEVFKLPLKGTMGVSFSPKNSFFQVFQKPTGQDKNLTVRRMEGGEVVLQQFQKAFSKASWPSVQFSEDELVASRTMSSEVQIYDPQDWSRGVVERVKAVGIAGAQIAVAPPSHIAVHVGEAKGAPASIRVFRRPVSPDSQPTARRSFYKANSVRLFWNKGSTGVLALAHSDVDKTNQSYYGESTLHFLTCDASFEGTVPLSKEGPIHDVQWSPSGKDFVVVHGYMPSKATLFDSKCRPLFDFGSGPRNLVRWSPHDRYMCLAGFGNLPGDVEFWERSSLKCVGKTRAAMGVSVEWSPRGQEVMVATTAPRLQVDNGIRVFTPDGSLVYQKSYAMLFQVDWRPSPEDLYPNKPFVPSKPSPVSSSSGAESSNTTGPKVTPLKTPPSPSPSPSPAPAYRPPGARGSDVPSSFRAQLSGEKDKPRVIGEASKSNLPESKSAAKNKKRREKEKKKEESGENNEAEAVTKRVESLGISSTGGSQEEGGGGDVAKKIRALGKKLRQIEELKKKGEEGGNLTEEQKEKVKQEKEVRKELATLEGSSG